ncbi:uncharacterized protein J7T54_001395 [Emericellopsis cladophorae]|uniref:Zn(2)-C6 fungal-type domain-containing protein n=1 Tax=Emericellopsis cladophorae TaxID=2686198 RepID=A0A9Q0BAI9_9HYPO|nr:uncharacterized protein J7T54_001395 [Emericellopsis cladophorae]KAI6777786.1 hypothetical protein J7T54_001395 [Emericellopsis cladophorae]
MNAHARTINRMRPSLACVPCKRKKVKCEKQKPECAQCKRTTTSCVYDNPGADPLAKRQGTVSRTRTEGHLSKLTGMTTINQSNGQRQREQPSPPPPPPQQLSPLSHSMEWVDFSETRDIGIAPPQFDDAMNFLEADGRILTPYMITMEGFDPPRDLSDILRAESRSMELDRAITSQRDSDSAPMASRTTGTTGPDSEQHYYQAPRKNNHHYSQRANPKQDRPHPGNQGSWGSTTGTRTSADSSSDPTPEDSDHEAHSIEMDDWESKPWRYNPVEAGHLRMSGFPSEGKLYQGNYFAAPFWLWSCKQESDAMLVMHSLFSARQIKYSQHRRQFSLARFVGCLPSKRMCDVLLRAFLVGVRPLLPLLSVSNLEARYHAFWAQKDALSDTANGVKANDNELSFVCLLWCVLFGGAVSASPAALSDVSFRVVDRMAFKKHMGAKAKDAIQAACGRDLQFPSLDGLVASLILYHCDWTMDPMVEEPPFIARCFQAACRLGLHREAALIAMPSCDAEIGRRVWYTLLEMDVVSSIRCGLSLSHCGMESSFDTREPRNGPDDLASTITAAQCRMTHVLRRILERSRGGDGSARPDSDLAAAIEQFDSFVDEAAAQLPVRGLPERGQISSQLLGANPLTHAELYLENTREATVLNAFCRIRLRMMKYTVSIAFNRMFLDKTPREGEAARLMSCQITNCVQFLRNYLHLAGLPAFAPYQWYCPGRLNAWQECMVVLSFLRSNSRIGRSRQLLLHILSDMFDMSDMLASRELNGLQGKVESGCPWGETWAGMRRLYEQVRSGVQDPNDYENVAQLGAETRLWFSSDWDDQSGTFEAESG